MTGDLFPGRNYPLGATAYPHGVNFSVFSRNAKAVELLLFDHEDDAEPSRRIPLDPARHRTFHYWHALVPNIGDGQLYGYCVHGAMEPERGMWFDGDKLLVDPYARCVAVPKHYDREAASRPGRNWGSAYKSVVVDRRGYDWEGDEPLRLSYARSVIYELHVGGFTRHPSSGVAPELRGTFAGLVEKIPYLVDLGITAVELMPVQQFDVSEGPGALPNYWGYSPVAFFAPHRGYSSRTDPIGPVYEFREMVKALHRAGIEVILDVVFNHTAEGNEHGPTFSLRGFENLDYYLLGRDPSRYANYSGCGNTLNANRAVTRRLIKDSLRYWAGEMHVDGFRFDLASAFTRNEQGESVANPTILWDIESDPVLAGTKIIAEAWDAAGLYQVGSFVGHRWAEWNGEFRDDVRRFIKGDPGMVRAFADKITASRQLYTRPDREPNRSINFVTCHDGFTLNDLVCYEEKHNHANLEDNRDGHNANYTWNCGVEGPTDDPEINALRLRQLKNHLAVLFLSQGTPMFLMGDECRRTQQGNNNAHCQDNEISWLDWRFIDEHAAYHRFVKVLIDLTQNHELFEQERFWLDTEQIVWHGVRLNRPDWGDSSHTLAFTLRDQASGEHMHAMINAFWEDLEFEISAVAPGEAWHRLIDTALDSPEDIHLPDFAPAVTGNSYPVQARSVVLLMALPTPEPAAP